MTKDTTNRRLFKKLDGTYEVQFEYAPKHGDAASVWCLDTSVPTVEEKRKPDVYEFEMKDSDMHLDRDGLQRGCFYSRAGRIDIIVPSGTRWKMRFEEIL